MQEENGKLIDFFYLWLGNLRHHEEGEVNASLRGSAIALPWSPA